MTTTGAVSIIPARGGSQRVPGKNIRLLRGRPMIAWVIDVAIASGLFDDVIVSTDSADIARAAEAAGAHVPFVRPASLSDDRTSLLPVMRHAVDALALTGQTPVAMLYATAVGLRTADIARGLAALTDNPNADYILGVVRYSHPTQRALILGERGEIRLLDPSVAGVRTQDLPPTWYDAGQIVCGRADAWRDEAPILSRAAGVELPSWRCVDVDTEEDLRRAAIVLELLADAPED